MRQSGMTDTGKRIPSEAKVSGPGYPGGYGRRIEKDVGDRLFRMPWAPLKPMLFTMEAVTRYMFGWRYKKIEFTWTLEVIALM